MVRRGAWIGGGVVARRRWAAVGVALVLAATAACGSDGDDGDGPSGGPAGSASGPGTTVAPEAPAPDRPGPHAVGHLELTVVDPERPGRELPTAVWYPAEAVDGAEPSFYSFVGDVGVTSELSVDDAPALDGPFPLVVFSHGNGGTRTQSTFLAEALASHGFVVAAPDHVGNTAADLVTGAGVSQVQSAVDRPLDVSAVIDAVVARSEDPADPLAGTVDDEHIGVTGHSFGGYTSLVTAVATGGVPTEPRVDAIAPLAPASSVIGDDGLASITVPTLLVGGTLDETTEIEPEITRPFGLISSDVLLRVDVEGAGHISFTSICGPAAEYAATPDAVPLIVGYIEGLAGEGCGEGYAPVERVHDLTNRYVVAFFRVHLTGDAAYEAYLTPTEGATFASAP